MSQFNAPAYDIERPTGHCAFTGRKLEPGEAYMAALVETDPVQAGGTEGAKPQAASSAGTAAGGLGFRRLDVSMEAWQANQRPERMFGYWKTTVPEANQKRRLFVDDEILLNLFRRLADADQPQRLSFRFVLGLILMRKRLLKYEGSERKAEGEAVREWWKVSAKGDAEPMLVFNPQMDEAQIQQVTEQLGEVLEAEV